MMRETELLPLALPPSPHGRGAGGEALPFLIKTTHPIRPINVMALIQSNRNIGQLLRKTTDVHKKQLLTNIMKANSKIIVSL